MLLLLFILLLVDSETWMMCIEKGKSSPLERSTTALTLSLSCRPGTALWSKAACSTFSSSSRGALCLISAIRGSSWCSAR